MYEVGLTPFHMYIALCRSLITRDDVKYVYDEVARGLLALRPILSNVSAKPPPPRLRSLLDLFRLLVIVDYIHHPYNKR